MGKQLVIICDARYAIPMLEELKKEAKRFKDLETVVNNLGTRNKTLNILKQHDLIKVTPIQVDDNVFKGYKITARGKQILDFVRSIESSLAKKIP